jgi:spermidine synthase
MKSEIKSGLVYSLFALGISSVTLQVLLMRELLAYTGGNELVIGIYLSFWMLYTGLGSFLGRYFRSNVEKLVPLFQFILLAVSVAAYLSVPLLRIQHGGFISVIGVSDLILLTLLVLLLPCLMLGVLFPLLSGALHDKGTGKLASYSYGFEAAGSIAGGILIVVLLLIFLDNRSAWIFLFAVNIPAIIHSSGYLRNRYYRLMLIAFSLGLLVVWVFTDPESHFEKKFLAGKELLASADTPYGRLVATGSGEQVNFFENSTPLFSTGEIISTEEPVHLGMSFVPDPQKILVVAGGNPGFIDELMKYGPGTIDYVTADPWAFKVIGEVIDIPGADILNIVFTDPMIFLRRSNKNYDVILVLTPPPSTASANRYFTVDFYDLCRKHRKSRQ